jgi:hypothetical protein
MNLITDESNADLAGLLGTIRIMAPELWGSSERRFILPQRLEDLEKPEYLEEIKGKINKVKMLKDMLDTGSITHSEYLSKKAKILLRI